MTVKDHIVVFTVAPPLSFLTYDKWYVTGHKLAQADFLSQSQMSHMQRLLVSILSFYSFIPFSSFHLYVCIHLSLVLFLFLSPPLPTLMFLHLRVSDPP